MLNSPVGVILSIATPTLPPVHPQPSPDTSIPDSTPARPFFASEIIDEIIDYLLSLSPSRCAERPVVRNHILSGNLQRPIQRALDHLDVDALVSLTGVCPASKWIIPWTPARVVSAGGPSFCSVFIT
ncbi:hypothetical protein BDK51DRAFT_29371 [Blyttiomyces helicus]|uniref:Uncharacterized protein n=1 Tax=Blyttiomyces helicus TaxID=388810 RepID=A0A4P9WM24_9FUNG|nr:hypothetical protein BDK51DRAFT_29371 [Blyttiomyces helicus]|eukprot:RKO92708.1 hypothetical protein BDK51DRAFT_29371 [Blyttiomyces helicus]